MGRFGFGGGKDKDGEQEPPAEANDQPGAPQAGGAQDEDSSLWMSHDDEGWGSGHGDEPAPVTSEHADQPRAAAGHDPAEPVDGDYEDERETVVPQGHASDAHPAAEAQAAAARQAQGGAGPASRGSDQGGSGSRVSVVDEQPPRPAPPEGASEDEYKWHTYKVYPSGRPDAVEFIDTYKAFGRARILRGLNMGLPEGMVSMILGPSGTGKSVCIKHMVGLLYPDQGDILVHGESVPNMPDDDLFEMRKKFGLLFQDGALFGSMNLYDNVAFPLRQHTEKGEDEIEDIVMRRLNEVGLGSAKEKMPNELSGGMRKRAGFARALVLEPDIVLFDEPDSGLDPVRTALLGELILEIHRDMMDEAKAKQKERLPTFAVITHDIMSARRVADYINVLWKGRIVEAGPAEDMLNSDNPFIRQFLAGESQGPLTMD
jgi:phospholipid/cholesterol/gamma-HCH transport system ATP-binding protein